MNKPNIRWIGSPHFSAASKKLKTIAIVNHVMSGTLAGTDSWFSNPSSKVSSHFGVGKSGEIHQYVSLDNPAWANGSANKPDWPLLKSGVNPNYYTVSIEHEGQSGDVVPEAQYKATLSLHRWLIDVLGIVPSPDTIIGHYRIDSINKATCPGTGFPWARLLKDLQEGENDILEVAVLLNTKEDFWAGADVAAKHGNCAIFIRPSTEAKKAKTLIVVGGSSIRQTDEILLSGNDKYDTAAAVKEYLG